MAGGFVKATLSKVSASAFEAVTLMSLSAMDTAPLNPVP